MAKLPRRVVSFLLVGVASAAVDAGVFALLVFLGVHPVLATVIGFMSAFIVNYRGNRDIVFRASHDAAHRGALVRYTILVIVNLGLSAASVAAGIAVGLDPLVAKVISMAIIAVVNFWAMRTWVFPGHRAPANTEQNGRENS